MGLPKNIEAGDIGTVPVCRTCGSERVVRDAWACWNPDSGLWELEEVFDLEYCRHCEAETEFQWRWSVGATRGAVRDLNDQFRREGRGTGTVLITQGLQERGADFIRKAVAAVQTFDNFTEDTDPRGEHDFGAVEIENERVFWKIDAYDPTRTMASDNPGNAQITHRVLTIMMASECAPGKLA